MFYKGPGRSMHARQGLGAEGRERVRREYLGTLIPVDKSRELETADS